MEATNPVKSLIPSFSPPVPSGNQMATIRGDNLYMPEEIVIYILERLPVKSLLRFQSVCKDWRNLFKSSFFIQEHTTHNKPLRVSFNSMRSPLSLLRYDRKMETVEVERIPLLTDSSRRVTGIIGSSNGLICVAYYDERSDCDRSLALLNPATKEVLEIPRSTIDVGRGWGFGYSHVVQDYKIVAIRVERERDRYSSRPDYYYVYSMEVFSLRNWSWKEVEYEVFEVISLVELDGCRPVTVNGSIFWLERSLAFDHGKIVSFDLASEVFTMIPIPSSITSANEAFETSNMFLDVYEYENKVAMIHKHKDSFNDIWVLEEGSDANGKRWCWTKKHSIISPSPSFSPKCLWRNEIIFLKIDGDSGSLFILTSNNEFRKLRCSLAQNEIPWMYSFFFM